MALNVTQLAAPPQAPQWFIQWQVQLAKVLTDLASQVAQARGQEGRPASVGSNLDLGSHRLVNVADAQSATDAVSKSQLDALATLVDQVSTLRGGEAIMIQRTKGNVLVSVRCPARLAAVVPVNFNATFYVVLHDVAGLPCYIPCMDTSW